MRKSRWQTCKGPRWFNYNYHNLFLSTSRLKWTRTKDEMNILISLFIYFDQIFLIKFSRDNSMSFFFIMRTGKFICFQVGRQFRFLKLIDLMKKIWKIFTFTGFVSRKKKINVSKISPFLWIEISLLKSLIESLFKFHFNDFFERDEIFFTFWTWIIHRTHRIIQRIFN